ncbi:MAG: hypothetical protein KatS3mg003_1612 [Candidatus Nitrosocaldaceae archaeon]|nr:MAG: hypothetical protein KatS3mg003_0455 [Candidatus Nitrosocaldaceae archaeon]GIU72133.1 MAG: hypothetical protein KatS3mg003_1612 [Candidatus Nitrosocaldaceae archaeon]
MDISSRLRKGYTLNTLLNKLWKDKLVNRFKNAKRASSFLLNYKLFLIQNALIDANGKLTLIGRYTLELGKRYGYKSNIGYDIITYIMLKYGGHYLLLSKIYKEQLDMDNNELSRWESWIDSLLTGLNNQNYYISKDDFRIDLPRLPYAYKKYFKIARYVKGRGLLVDYPRVVEILEI